MVNLLSKGKEQLFLISLDELGHPHASSKKEKEF
jgi:hypothetical protein